MESLNNEDLQLLETKRKGTDDICLLHQPRSENSDVSTACVSPINK